MAATISTDTPAASSSGTSTSARSPFLPDEAGWWWWKKDARSKSVCVEVQPVSRHDTEGVEGDWLVRGAGFSSQVVRVQDMDGIWLGKVEPPTNESTAIHAIRSELVEAFEGFASVLGLLRDASTGSGNCEDRQAGKSAAADASMVLRQMASDLTNLAIRAEHWSKMP